MRSDKELEKDQMKEKTEHMCKKMKKEDWLSLLERKNVGISILPPDSYSTVYEAS